MTAWQTARIVALDTETTGKDPETALIVSIALVSLETVPGVGLRIHTELDELVDPGVPIPAEASTIHGITDEHVKGAPAITDLGPRINAVLTGAEVLCGYNILRYDRPVLERAIPELAPLFVRKPILDPLVIVRLDRVGRYWKGEGRHKLGNVCKRLGISHEGEHGAVADARAALRVLWKLRHYVPTRAHEASEFLARARVKQEADRAAWIAKQPPRESPESRAENANRVAEAAARAGGGR